MGIPHSTFLSWPDTDQDKAIAFILLESRKCSSCGTVPEEWINPEDKTPLEPPPYAVEARRCYGCVELDDERDMVPKGKKGMQFFFRPVDDGDADG